MSGFELFELILGRPPKETERHLMSCQANQGYGEAAAALLSSHEFLIDTAEPLLDGTIRPERAPISDPLQRWAEAHFGLASQPCEPRLGLLLRMIEGPVLSPLVGGLDTMWSPGAFKFAVEATLGYVGEVQSKPLNALEAARRVVRGLEIDALSNLSIGHRPRELSLDGERPAISFHLSDAPKSPEDVYRLDFGLIAEGPDPQGILWLDYGDGFDRYGLELRGRGRSAYTAYLAAPGQIKALRWEVRARSPSVMLTNLSARPVSPEQLTRQILTVAGRRGLDWLAGKRLPQLQPAHSSPPGFLLTQVLTRRLGGHNLGRGYPDWLADNELSGDYADAVWFKELAALKYRPDIDLFVTVDCNGLQFLRQTINSITNQIYPHWSVTITLNFELDDAALLEMDALAASGPRINIAARRSESSSLNAALAQAKGEWLVVLSPGELLRPNALLQIASRIAQKPNTRLLYADHDELDEMGTRVKPAFKPDFSPEMLLSYNYISRPVFFRTADVRLVGGWSAHGSALGDYKIVYDILSAIGRDAVSAVEHIAEVLLHRPMPLALSDEARQAEAEIVRQHLARVGVQAEVELSPTGIGQRVRPHLPNPVPMLSLIMPTRDRADLLTKSVGSILAQTAYDPFELLIVDNDSQETSTHLLLEQFSADPRVRVVKCGGEFNYSYINNMAASVSRGEVLGLINNDIEVVSSSWAEELVAWATMKEIGCVGAKLYYPNGSVQHGGVILGINGVAAHSHKYASMDDIGYGMRLSLTHNLSAVTGACLFVKKEVYNLVGGLDEGLKVAFNDVDFCLEVAMAGFRNIIVPHVELIHHESASRGTDATPEKLARFMREINLMKKRWGSHLINDPFYSPNLTRTHENFDLNWDQALRERLWA